MASDGPGRWGRHSARGFGRLCLSLVFPANDIDNCRRLTGRRSGTDHIGDCLFSMRAPVRLSVVDTSSALEAANAFSSEKADLAAVRGDVGDLSQAQAVIVVAHAVAC
jgi:hypothetical protein